MKKKETFKILKTFETVLNSLKETRYAAALMAGVIAENNLMDELELAFLGKNIDGFGKRSGAAIKKADMLLERSKL